MTGGRGRRLPLVSRNRHERPPNTDMSHRMQMVPHRSILTSELYDDDKNWISFENAITELPSSVRRIGSRRLRRPSRR